jgi:AbrB family looped-hinge helix DNA binding protein
MKKKTFKITPNGRITIPKTICEHLGIGPGSIIDYVVNEDKTCNIVVVKASPDKTKK